MAIEKQYEVLSWAFSFLKKYNREEKVAEILLQHHLQVARSHFYTMMQEEVPLAVQEKFKADVRKHAFTGVPVQHLTGYEYFYGRRFQVNQHVLIPRPETEELVEHVIQQVRKKCFPSPITIVDIGTGSGVIAITLALELSNAIIYATDISTTALQMAKKNAEIHQASVHFSQGDFLRPICEQRINPHIIVSNPPYIKEADKEGLLDTVKNYDPAIALFANRNGLEAYEKIISQTKKLEKFGERLLCFEIGYDQATAVTSLINQQFPNSEIKTIKDINNRDRIISAQL